MNFDILEGFVVTLIEMIMTGDHTGWEAIRKYREFSRDIQKHYEIVEKRSKNEE